MAVPTEKTMPATDITVRDVSFDTEDFTYRAPIKFGGSVVDRVTVLNAHVTVETRTGRVARGFGSMPLGNVWAFPSRTLTYSQTLSALGKCAELTAGLYAAHREWGHPVDLGHALEPAVLGACDRVGRELGLDEPVPPLAALVAGSPFDAALHDGFGKANGLNCYRTYGPDFLPRDLGHYLGPEFAGRHLSEFVSPDPVPRLPLYHLVGALDPLTPADVVRPVGDGLPEHLGAWVRADGLTHLKVKLNGDELDWDVGRVAGVEAVVLEAQPPGKAWFYSLDFNERCPNVGYLLEFLARLRQVSPAALGRVQYIEQPTRRNLAADRSNTMHAASAVVPVVIDESLLGLESLRLAREMGYTGAALKACKGQTQSLLMAAAARVSGMFLCVQDLTCPGASLVHSAGLAAHVPGVSAIESNARQYCPAANSPWADRFPGLFHISAGAMDTSGLTGPGLGAVPG